MVTEKKSEDSCWPPAPALDTAVRRSAGVPIDQVAPDPTRATGHYALGLSTIDGSSLGAHISNGATGQPAAR